MKEGRVPTLCREEEVPRARLTKEVDVVKDMIYWRFTRGQHFDFIGKEILTTAELVLQWES